MSATSILRDGEGPLGNLGLIGGADVMRAETLTTGSELGALGTILSTVEQGETQPGDTGTSPLAGVPSNLQDIAGGVVAQGETAANAAVNGFHATLEGASHGSPVNDPVHGVTNLGQDIGLGHLGGDAPNLLNDTVTAPSDLAAGGNPTYTLAEIGRDLDTQVAPGVGELVTEVAATPLGGGIATGSVTRLANDAVGDFHTEFQGVSDALGVSGPVHAITTLGETVGLGHLGENTGQPNPLTGVLDAPGTLLSGGGLGAATAPVTTGLGQVLGAAGDLGASLGSATPIGEGASLAAIGGLADNLTIAAGLGTPVGTTVSEIGATLPGLGEPIPAVVGAAVTDVAQGLNMVVGGTVLTPVATDVAGAVGQVAGIATDIVAAPGEILAGGSIKGSVDGALDALSPAGHALGTALSDVGHAIPTDLGTAPVLALADVAVLDGHGAIEGTSDGSVVGDPAHGITALGETVGLGHLTDPGPGGSNLLTDAAAAPGAIASGGNPLGAAPGLAGDIADVVQAGGHLVDIATATGLGENLTTAPLTGAIGQIASGVTGGGLPGLGGGLPGLGGGLPGLGGGGQNGDTHPVVAASAGPAQSSSGLELNLLNPAGSETHHSADATVGSAPGTGPASIGLAALTGGGDQLHFPSLGGAGSDALTGQLVDVGHGSQAGAPAPTDAVFHALDPIVDLHGLTDTHHIDPAAHAPGLAHGLGL